MSNASLLIAQKRASRLALLATALLLGASPVLAQTVAPAATNIPGVTVVTSAVPRVEPKTDTRTETGLTARGVVRPWHEVKIAADIVAKVKALPLRVGDSFEAGGLLVEFDCGRLQADLKAARAVEAEHASVYRTNVTLQKHRAAGANEVEVARARLAKASAESESLSLRIRQCRIEAPFAGRVAERMIDLHEMPQANQPLLKVVSAGDTEVALIVPSAWLKWLKPGVPFEHVLDDTGAVLVGEVTRVGAAIDAVSQTIEVFGHIKDIKGPEGALVLPGMGGVARFPAPQG
jgi:membrane fusion protein, multidrug efflux system